MDRLQSHSLGLRIEAGKAGKRMGFTTRWSRYGIEHRDSRTPLLAALGGLLCCLFLPAVALAGAEDNYDTPPEWAHDWWFPNSDVITKLKSKSAPPPQTTYDRLVPLAEAGDAETQNFIGFMFFQGEAVKQDYDRAHTWFHRAAEEGHPSAQRNLGILHARSLPGIPERFYNPEEANLWLSLAATASPHAQTADIASKAYSRFLNPELATRVSSKASDLSLGEQIFTSLCAGCHGFDGFAAYPAAPSFALHEALHQSDPTLLHSILNGKNIMPAWKDTLSREMAQKVLAYIRDRFRADRSLAQASKQLQALQSPPDQPELANGRKLYERFCAGCHGFNGISYYVHSPSFALRERLDKSDEVLAESITYGINAMPSWGFLLQQAQIFDIVRYLRTLAPTYEAGIAVKKRTPEGRFFRFRPQGEDGPEWDGADPMGVLPTSRLRSMTR